MKSHAIHGPFAAGSPQHDESAFNRNTSGWASKSCANADLSGCDQGSDVEFDGFETPHGTRMIRESGIVAKNGTPRSFDGDSGLAATALPCSETGKLDGLGRYQLVASLAKGGMAELFLAAANSSRQRCCKLVAIKRVRDDLSGKPEVQSMFLDEARLALRLHHPNVVETFELEQIGDEPTMVMEYLDGQPLSRLLPSRAEHPRPEPASLRLQLTIVADALAGLHHAHTLRDFDGTAFEIVHRDVSPSNIFLTYDGQVKVLDFGIAKIAGAKRSDEAGAIRGKIAYMAPEQAQSQAVDCRADIFAVGVMLFEMAVGQRMWPEMPLMGVLGSLCREDYPQSPKTVDPAVPEELDAICSKALAPNPRDRFSSACDMQDAIEAYLDTLGGRASAREMGAWLRRNFEEERSRMADMIETRLGQMNDRTAPPTIAPDALEHEKTEDLLQTMSITNVHVHPVRPKVSYVRAAIAWCAALFNR